MASRSFQTLFLRAQERFDRNGRHVLVTFVFLLLVQILVLAPFAGLDPGATSPSDDRLEALPAELAAVRSDLEEASEAARRALAPALERLTVELEQDLAQLQAVLGLATRMGLAASEESAEPIAPPDDLPFGLDADTFDLLSRSPNRYAALTVLEPIVEDDLLAPRFAELDRVWNDEALPPLEAEIEAASAALSRLRGRQPEPRRIWEDVVGGVAGLRRAARDLGFSPPERAYWWASPESDLQLALGLWPATAEELRRPRALDEWDVQLARVLSSHGSLASAIDDSLAARREAAGRAAERRGRLGGALAAVGIEIEALARYWPLVLALGLSAAIVRRDQRRRELALATRMLVRHGGPPSLVRWCLLQISAGAEPEAAPSTLASRFRWRALGGLVIGWGWIALASWLAYPLPFDLLQWWPALAGALLLLLGTSGSLSLAGRLLELTGADLWPDEEPPDPGLALPDPEQRGQELTGLELR